VWQIPRTTLFRGLRDNLSPTMIVLQEKEKPVDPGDVDRLIRENKLILFYSDDDPWSYMLHSVLNNIGAEDLKEVDVSGDSSLATRMRRQLEAKTSKPTVPYLFLEGVFLGKREDIVNSYLAGRLQQKIKDAGLRVLLKTETPSLAHNDFGYPKGGLTDPRDGKRNVLVCACGSSAADKVPELVQKLSDNGHNVKLIPSPQAEHFFKDVKERDQRPYNIYDHITPKDVYRDSDEWNFRYTQFDMQVRASHLALCDWADCVIVAPITCNTMGKIAHGIGDTLLTSVFVAWQYQTKPVIFCPACNTNMWNNITTQNNVDILKRLGGTFAGPRTSTLSNGTRGIGAMVTPDEIVVALNTALDDLDHQPDRVIKWAKEASMSSDPLLWDRIFRMIREDVVGVNVLDHETKDSLLHFACGGPGETLGTGTIHGVEHVAAVQELLEFGIDVNMVNNAGYSGMHVAIKNGAEDIIKLILNSGEFNVLSCMQLLAETDVELSDEVREMFNEWAKTVRPDASAEVVELEREPLHDDNDTTYLYFTYGSLKRGFPNHEGNAKLLSDFVGVATTTQTIPLIVQKEPNCDNPNCNFLHRMATLVDKRGAGKHVAGEVYRVTAQGLKELDKLEDYDPNNQKNSTYLRKTIAVEVGGMTEKAFCYFIANPEKYNEAVKAGTSEIVSEYTEEMAVAIPKPKSG
ncbi:MAG: flavoprotein, partial [Rhizobiaceae bacterium]